MQVSRRDFLKTAAFAAGARLLAGLAFSQKGQAAVLAGPGPNVVKTMLYDSARCTGCRACEAACKQWNHLPGDSADGLSAQTWTVVRDLGAAADPQRRKYQCLHCTEAACVKVCPTHALTYNPSGFVAYDEARCSGCGYCAEFCPFQVPRLEGNVLTGLQKMQMCTFCQDRVAVGRPTACAEACPYGALLFGARDELAAEGRKRTAALKTSYPRASFFGENELGGLHVMYVLKDTPSAYLFPENPQVPPEAFAWKDAIQPVGWIVGGLTILGLGLNFLTARDGAGREKEK
jgi:formate dehydrogenase iron-sulfur subunit